MYWNKEFETMPWQEVQESWLSKVPAFIITSDKIQIITRSGCKQLEA